MKFKIIVITLFLMISLIGYSHAGVASGTVGGGSAIKPSASQFPAQVIQQVPFAPGNLILEVISSSQINLKWNDTSKNETGFAVERKTGNGQFSEIGRVGQNVVIYGDQGLSANSTYTYRVRAYNSAGYSPYTEEKSATTQSLKTASPVLNKGGNDSSAFKAKLSEIKIKLTVIHNMISQIKNENSIRFQQQVSSEALLSYRQRWDSLLKLSEEVLMEVKHFHSIREITHDTKGSDVTESSDGLSSVISETQSDLEDLRDMAQTSFEDTSEKADQLMGILAGVVKELGDINNCLGCF